MERFYSTSEVAAMCHVTPGSVIRWVSEGKLETSLTAGGHRRIAGDNVMKLVKSLNLPLPPELVESERGKFIPKILIVDDETNIRQLVRWILAKYFPGAEVEEAGDGFEAGWKAREMRPNLIILDLLLPGLDGFRFCQLVRSFTKLQYTRILAITGAPDPDFRERILKLGADDFLPKPFDVEDLKQKIEGQLKTAEKLAAVA